MLNYIINCIIWVLALYGFLEIVKTIIYIHTCNNIKSNGIHLIVGVRNEENSIEAFLRTLNFRILYGKENNIEDILVIDLNSIDSTKKIIEKLALDLPNIKSISWNEFEELFSPYLK